VTYEQLLRWHLAQPLEDNEMSEIYEGQILSNRRTGAVVRVLGIDGSSVFLGPAEVPPPKEAPCGAMRLSATREEFRPVGANGLAGWWSGEEPNLKDEIEQWMAAAPAGLQRLSVAATVDEQTLRAFGTPTLRVIESEAVFEWSEQTDERELRLYFTRRATEVDIWAAAEAQIAALKG